MRRRRPLSALCACLLILLAGVAASAWLDEEPVVRFRGESELSAEQARLATDARLAIRRLNHWIRPFPHDALTIIEQPWFRTGAGHAGDGEVIVPAKMLAARRDRSAARALVVGLTKLYWPQGSEPGALGAGVRDYIATRVMHDQFSGTHYFTIDVLGGFATYALRPVLLTRSAHDHRPPVRHFPETSNNPDVRRVVDAMFTLERYIGWPTLQYAVADWLKSDRSASSLELFEASLQRASGRDLSWFTRSAFSRTARFDYAAAALTTSADALDGWHEVSATVARHGSAIFPVDIELVFADGTRIRERWEGRDPSITRRYRSRSEATALVVDPDLVLLLDEDRRNNALVYRVPLHAPGVRWTLQWATWVQNALLTVTALT